MSQTHVYVCAVCGLYPIAEIIDGELVDRCDDHPDARIIARPIRDIVDARIAFSRLELDDEMRVAA